MGVPEPCDIPGPVSENPIDHHDQALRADMPNAPGVNRLRYHCMSRVERQKPKEHQKANDAITAQFKRVSFRFHAHQTLQRLKLRRCESKVTVRRNVPRGVGYRSFGRAQNSDLLSVINLYGIVSLCQAAIM